MTENWSETISFLADFWEMHGQHIVFFLTGAASLLAAKPTVWLAGLTGRGTKACVKGCLSLVKSSPPSEACQALLDSLNKPVTTRNAYHLWCDGIDFEVTGSPRMLSKATRREIDVSVLLSSRERWMVEEKVRQVMAEREQADKEAERALALEAARRALFGAPVTETLN